MAELGEDESYFWAISKLSPENQREALKLMMVKLALKQEQAPSAGRAIELAILGDLVKLPLAEMADAISTINAKEQAQ